MDRKRTNKTVSTVLYGTVGLAALIALVWYGANLGDGVTPQQDSGPTPPPRAEDPVIADKVQQQDDGLPDKALIANVPFTSQAPSGQWGDSRYQDGCEEASVLMSAKWLTDTSIGSADDATAQILTLSQLSDSLLGTHVDTSAADTLKLFRAYTKTTKGVLKYDVTLTDIKHELAAGNIVMAPMNGQALNNPNFTGDGPERHFLVIIGYDDATGMFTTNDPGTRNGRNYRYTYETLFAAMRDYPTGDHEAITHDRRAMISVSKN